MAELPVRFARYGLSRVDDVGTEAAKSAAAIAVARERVRIVDAIVADDAEVAAAVIECVPFVQVRSSMKL
jgi:hypothetical protein